MSEEVNQWLSIIVSTHIFMLSQVVLSFPSSIIGGWWEIFFPPADLEINNIHTAEAATASNVNKGFCGQLSSLHLYRAKTQHALLTPSSPRE
jgi:hypothetical protein